MRHIDNNLSMWILKIPALYSVVYLILFLLVLSYYLLIVRPLMKIWDWFIDIIKLNGSFCLIRVKSEINYIIKKFFYLISPRIITTRYSRDSIFEKTNILSPIYLYRIIKTFVISMFKFSTSNIIIWLIILYYFNPSIYKDSWNVLINLRANFPIILQNVDLKALSSYISFFTLVFSMIILIMLTPFTFKWKAMKKIEEEKYEKAVEYQEKMQSLLVDVLLLSEKNIEVLDGQIKYLPDRFGQLITKSTIYYLEKGTLKRYKHTTRFRTNLDNIVSLFEAFKKQIDEVNEILKKVYELRLNRVFYKIDRPVRFESIYLGLNIRTSLGIYLIEKDRLKTYIENKLNQLSYLTNKFTQLNEVRSNWLSKEELEKQYNKNGLSFTFEEIVEDAERKLERELVDFKKHLKEELEDAIFYHTILKEYLNISDKNTRFSFFKYILSRISSK